MNFEQLLYVEVLSQHNSLQKAADVLHISKSGLSIAISQLEEELGVKLFERTSRGTLQTKAGLQLLASVSEILKAKNALENQACIIKNPDHSHKITIHYMNVMLKPFIESFLDHHKNNFQQTTLDISCHELPSIIQRVKNQEIDFGFIAINQLNNLDLQGLEFRPICHTKLVMYCSENNPLIMKNSPITLEDIKRQQFCLFNDDLHDNLFNILQSVCGPLPLVLRTDDSWAIQKTIKELGAVTFGRVLQEKLSPSGGFKELSRLNIGHIIDDQFTLGWLLNPNQSLSEESLTLIDMISKAVQEENTKLFN